MQLYLEIGSLQMIKLLLLGRTLIQYEWCPLEIRPGDKHAQREDATNTVEATEHRVHGMVSLASLLSSSRLCDNYFHTIFSDVPESFTSGLPYHDLMISRQ